MVGNQKASLYVGEAVKVASAATQTILSGGKYLCADLYALTLTQGSVNYFTGFDVALNASTYLPNSTFGPAHNYATGFTVVRGAMTQKVGLDAQELQLKISPQWDAIGGPPTVAGYSILQAAELGLLDNATIAYSRLFMNYPTLGQQLDTSPGGVAWFTGIVSDIDISRFELTVKLSSNLIILNQVQMPKNLYQATCPHTVYDAGCTLSKTLSTKTGTVTVVTNNSMFSTNMNNYGANYFSLGVMTFTSGLNKGFSGTVKTFSASGVIQTMIPFPATVNSGDNFNIYPGCDRTMATCILKNNLPHFKGTPFIPVPETLYDGGTANSINAGVITNNPIGSGPSGRILPQIK